MSPVQFPTADGTCAGQWSPTGTGDGTHVAFVECVPPASSSPHSETQRRSHARGAGGLGRRFASPGESRGHRVSHLRGTHWDSDQPSRTEPQRR
jgi:hypothetical protein